MHSNVWEGRPPSQSYSGHSAVGKCDGGLGGGGAAMAAPVMQRELEWGRGCICCTVMCARVKRQGSRWYALATSPGVRGAREEGSPPNQLPCGGDEGGLRP